MPAPITKISNKFGKAVEDSPRLIRWETKFSGVRYGAVVYPNYWIEEKWWASIAIMSDSLEQPVKKGLYRARFTSRIDALEALASEVAKLDIGERDER